MSATRAAADSRVASERLRLEPISIALGYLGLAIVLRNWLNVHVLRFSAVFFVAGALAFFGWRDAVRSLALRRYVGWALALAAWMSICAVASWTAVAEYNARMFIIWLVFITPGLASLLRDSARRHAFVGGLVVGVTVFGVAAVTRIARGLSVFDADPDSPDRFLLGVNRNAVVIRIVFALAFLFSDSTLPRSLRWVRWVSIASCAVTVLFSGARSGLLGLVVIVLAYVLLQPGTGRRLRTVYAVLLATSVVVIGIQSFGGEATVSTDRLSEGFSAEDSSSSDVSSSNEVRRLILRKDWHFAVENPLFGIGPGRLQGAYHPVIDEGTTVRIRRAVLGHNDRNGFADMLAETGFPGLALYLLLIASLVRSGWTSRHSAAGRAATSAFVGILFIQVTGIYRLDPLFFCPMAMVLGCVCALDSGDRPSSH